MRCDGRQAGVQVGQAGGAFDVDGSDVSAFVCGGDAQQCEQRGEVRAWRTGVAVLDGVLATSTGDEAALELVEASVRLVLGLEGDGAGDDLLHLRGRQVGFLDAFPNFLCGKLGQFLAHGDLGGVRALRLGSLDGDAGAVLAPVSALLVAPADCDAERASCACGCGVALTGRLVRDGVSGASAHVRGEVQRGCGQSQVAVLGSGCMSSSRCLHCTGRGQLAGQRKQRSTERSARLQWRPVPERRSWIACEFTDGRA